MSKKFDYSVGALITTIIGIGSAAIAYGGGFIIFDLFNLPAWILGPLGVYTLVFSFIDKDLYYLAWSIIFLATAVASTFYKLVNVILVVGILLIVIAIISTVAYFRGQQR